MAANVCSKSARVLPYIQRAALPCFRFALLSVWAARHTQPTSHAVWFQQMNLERECGVHLCHSCCLFVCMAQSSLLFFLFFSSVSASFAPHFPCSLIARLCWFVMCISSCQCQRGSLKHRQLGPLCSSVKRKNSWVMGLRILLHTYGTN